MNMHAKVQAEPIAPFNAYAAFERERAYSRVVERRLTRALQLLSMECDRRQLRGEDVAHIRAFLAEAAS